MALAGQVTNPERLEGRDVSFQSDGTAINGYLVRPREPGSYPGIIVIHEAWGVIEHIRDVARRFANLGYVVLAPDLYTRVGAPKTDDPMNIVLSRMLALSDAQLVRDLDKAADLLASQPGMTGKIGCVGFCMGGRTTLLYACSSNRLSSAIDCWGGGITADAAPVTRAASHADRRPGAATELPALRGLRRGRRESLARPDRGVAPAPAAGRQDLHHRHVQERRPRVFRRLPAELSREGGF